MRHKRTTELRYPSLSRGVVFEACPSLTGPTGSTVRDSSPFRNHGTLTNAPTWSIITGRQALSFVTASSQTITTSASVTTGPHTISVWIYRQSAAVNPDFFVAQRGASTLFQFWSRGDGTDRKLHYFNGTTIYDGTNNLPAANTRWCHVAAVHDGATTLRLYIDGALDSTHAVTLGTGGSPITVMTDNVGSYSTSAFADLLIASRAMTGSEIKTLATRIGIAYETVRLHHAQRRILRNRQQQQPIGVGIY